SSAPDSNRRSATTTVFLSRARRSAASKGAGHPRLKRTKGVKENQSGNEPAFSRRSSCHRYRSKAASEERGPWEPPPRNPGHPRRSGRRTTDSCEPLTLIRAPVRKQDRKKEIGS